jgi:ectoine hydroxylase-related dioxygenase (phytanoyl-CoA dioxygenase family)
MKDIGLMSKKFADEDEGRMFLCDTILWPRIMEFKRFAEFSPAAEIAAELMRSDEVRLLNDVIFYRTAGTQARSPYHQDTPYLCISGKQVCSLWMPLVSVSATSALAFVPGSHKLGKEFTSGRFGKDLADTENVDGYEPLPDIENIPDQYGVTSWGMEPGDCVMFDGMTLHGGSGQLVQDRELIAFSINWIGDDVRVRMRHGGMEPDLIPICARYGLREGDPLKCDGFPLVWSAGKREGGNRNL